MIDVEELLLDAAVTDRQRRPVAGLRAADFEVLEDGRRLEVLAVSTAGGPPLPATRVPRPGNSSAPAVDLEETSTPPPAREPLHVVLFFDQPHLRVGSRRRGVAAARRFVAEHLSPHDLVMVAAGAPGLQLLTTFTSERQTALAALDAIEHSPPAPDAEDSGRRHALASLLKIREMNAVIGAPPCLSNILEPVREQAEAAERRAKGTLQDLGELVGTLAAFPGRKVLVHVTDGLPLRGGDDLFQVLYEVCGPGQHSSGLPLPPGGFQDENQPGTFTGTTAALEAQQYSIAADLEAFTARANAHRVIIFPLQASGLGGTASAGADFGPEERVLQLTSVSQVQTANLRESLNALAANTGGRALLDANDLAGELAALPGELAGRYTLVVRSRHPGEGRNHRLEVRARQGDRVRHASSYHHQTWLERARDRTLGALLWGQEDNGLTVAVRMTARPPRHPGVQSFTARIGVPLNQLTLPLKDDRYRGSVRILVALLRDGKPELRERVIAVDIPRDQALVLLGRLWAQDVNFDTPVGELKIAVGVVDELSRLASYLTAALAVTPAPAPD